MTTPNKKNLPLEPELENLNADIWSISIPKDWQECTSEKNGQIYFKSSDGTKGIYVLVLNLHIDDKHYINEITEEQRSISRHSLNEMSNSGYRWSLLADEHRVQGLVYELLFDNYDPARRYRIIDKVLISLPFLMRVAFHDYECSNIATSDKYFRPIMESVKLLGERQEGMDKESGISSR